MKKAIVGVDDLATTNASILEEWNYNKNDILPTSITKGSSRKVWWICKKCGNEWMATPRNRIKGGTECPNCSLSKIGKNRIKSLIEKNGSLYDKKPNLVKEWDYEKNYPLTPNDVTCGSKKKVWWKCEKGHEWEATIRNRYIGSNCIFCTGQKAIIGENDLVTTHHELVKEWDYEKNVGLKPENVKSGSNIKVWWKCELGHSWQTSVNHRTNGTGCPHCYSEYGTSFPEQAICYYLSKVTNVKNREKIDNQEIDIYLPEYKIGFEYDGSYYHETEKSREKEKKKNEIIKQNNIFLYHIKESNKDLYDKEKNIIFCIIDRNYKYIEKVLEYIQQIINKKIENIDIINDRSNIYNQYIKSIKENNFAIYHPELLEEWDYEKNNGISPEYFSVGSNKKIWWKCPKCNSSYDATISHRLSGTGCPYCSGKKINETNNLKAIFPDLVKLWDYDKNDILPEMIYFSSRKKVWWKCPSCEKSFLTPVCSRIRAKTPYCPECMHNHIGIINRKKTIKKNGSLFDDNSPLLKEWNYQKNVDITPKDVSSKSGIKVWWKCSKCGNEWNAKIFNRSYGTGCPKCRYSILKNKSEEN